jgi:hypothetical protein
LLWITLALMILGPVATLLPTGEVHAQEPTVESPAEAGETTQAAPTHPRPQEPPAQPLIFSDDFETYGDDSRWSTEQHLNVQREIVGEGLYSARLTNTGAVPMYGLRTLPDTYDRIYARFSFQVIEIGTKPVTLFQFRPSRTKSIVSIQIQPSGQISYTTSATGITSVSTSSTTFGEWHDLQVLVDTKASENNIRIWIDDNAITSLKPTAWLGDTGGIHVVQLGDNSAGQQSDIAFDKVLVDKAFIPASRQADPVPGTLRIRAVPAWSGIEFELDGEIFRTDQNGVVRIQVKRWSTDLKSRITVHDAKRGGGSKITFTGWREWPYADSKDVYATFELWEPVAFNFTDENGEHVDQSLIDTIVLKSSLGEIYTLTADDLDEPELHISNVVNTPVGINTKSVTYYVDQVIIDGANVVNRSQQRMAFENGDDLNFQITLLFYQVKFQATDAFFGRPLGDEIVIQAPDGSKQHLPINDQGEVFIPRLPRGDYQITVVGGGYSPPRPLRISRDQVVQLEVISHLDFALMAGAASTVAIGLVVIGRPHVVTRPIAFMSGLLVHPRRLYPGRLGR